MAARVDDETMMAARRQLLAKGKQRRQIKIHRHAVDENQRRVGLLVRWREYRAVQSFVVNGSKGVDFGVVVHN